MSESDFNPRPRISMILPLPLSLLLIIFFFLPWLTISCDAGEFTKAMQKPGAANMPNMPPMTGMPEVTAKVGQASGWQLAKGNITLKGAYARKDGRPGSQNELLKSRPLLYMGLAAPILGLLLGGLGATGNAKPGTVGTGLLLLAVAGTVAVLWAASIDYVDDSMDKLQEEATKSRCRGPAPCLKGMEQSKANMKKLIKTEGTGYLWASLGMYVLLAGCGIAGRTTPLEPGFQVEPASAPAITGARSLERRRRAGADELPDFGPDLTPKEPAGETEDAAASDKPLSVMRSKDGI